jgi:hypothetical protein
LLSFFAISVPQSGKKFTPVRSQSAVPAIGFPAHPEYRIPGGVCGQIPRPVYQQLAYSHACGDPITLANLKNGEAMVNLGSGGGQRSAGRIDRE